MRSKIDPRCGPLCCEDPTTSFVSKVLRNFMSSRNGSPWLPSGNQTWLAGKWTMEIGDVFMNTSISMGCSIAMFDFQRVAILGYLFDNGLSGNKYPEILWFTIILPVKSYFYPSSGIAYTSVPKTHIPNSVSHTP